MRDCLASSLAVAVVILCSIPRRLLGQDTLCRDHDFYLNFPQRQANQFSKVAVTGDKAIEAFTICAWLKTSDVYHIGLLRYSDSAIIDRISLSVLPDTGQLRFTLLDEERRTKPLPEVRNNNWHGLCVTWKSVDGIFMVYYGGRLFYTENSLKTGVRLSSNHTFTVGIGNQNDEIFSGRLGHVNVWTKVLEHPLLAALSYKCGVERGDWISWPQFMKGAYGIDVVVGETCPFDGDDLPPDQLQYLRLNGEDASNLINLHYSAAFLEGRLDGQGSLYLDGTQAYVATPKVDLHMAFTIACWVKLVPTNSDFRAILRNDQNSPGFVFGVDSNQQLQFNNTIGVRTHVYTASNLHEKVWQHVAVSFVSSVEVSLYINGLQFPQISSYGFQWRRPAGNSFEVGRYLDPSNIYRYFHGYLSDLYVFGRALGVEDIGIIMGRSPSCTYKEWSSPPLLPGKAPTEKYGNFICPGIGQCKTVSPWRPADCREALLAVNRTSGVYMISPLNNDVEFQVFCDHDTHGGGWTVIQRRRSSSEKTNKTWAEYKTGFGKVNGKSEMWLGNDKIHALTTKDTELLIQLQGDDGSTGYAIYTDFRVSDEKDQYRLLLGTTAGFSGNISNSFFEHNNTTFTTADLTIGGNCAIAEGGGWWFTNCGDALLNSVMIKWSGFGTGVAITMTEMKIRRKDGFSSDYILKFPSGSVSYLLWPNILTELKAFSVCLWLRFQPLLMGTKDRSMILFQYRGSNGNATIKYSLTWGTLKTTIWSSNVRTSESIKNELLDDRWHHVCSIWEQVQAKLIFCIDSSCQDFTGTMGSVPLAGGGQICIGAGHSANRNHFDGEITLMNMWDYVLQQTFIQTLANSGGAETGNVLHWSFFAAMAVGNVQCSQYSSIFPKELHRWTFDQSSKTKSFDVNKKHKANITGARIATERPSVVIDDEGYFLSELASSDVSTDKGFTVSFSMRHSALTSDILQDDFEKLELLRTAFPTFIRDNALWKQCYSANQTSWRTQVFHSNCDNKGPSLTIIKTGDYIFGGFVEQSWGGPPADIGNQHEGFLFSLANPSNKYPQFLPILPGKPSGRTDPLLGPSFGQHDLELYQDASGRLKGFSGLGASFDITNISLSPSAARNFFTGSQQFYPDKVEVFYYHVPSKAVGIESRVIGDSDISSSSVLNQHFADHARLNELGEFWCSNTTDASSWLQVFLGRQYTLTHIAIQGINEFDVRAMTVKYEKTRDGENWITYSKHLDGNVNAKVVLFKNLSQEEIGKEAFFPPFEAVKVRLEVGSGTRCMKIELYYFDAGCSQAYGVEDPNTIPDEKISTSSTRNPSSKYDWPFRGRLNHNEGTRSWGPYKHPIYRQADSWIQVDLEKEQEVTCIDTQGRPAHTQYTKKYQVSYSTNGDDWRFYENNNGDKTFNANSDDDMTVRNWLHPPVYGRFIRIHLTECHSYCRIRLELYGRRNMSDVFPSGHGLGFIIRHGRYHVVFVKQKSLWEIRLPLILNKWFEATLTWAANDGLKFYVSGNLTASDNIPTQFGVTDNNAESFRLMIGSTEDVGGWARSTCIDDVTVWSTAMSEDLIKRKSQVFLDFDDNSRNWALFLAGFNDWKLNRGCTLTAGTGPCDDVSGGGHYIYFRASSPSARDYSHSARFTIPVRFSSSYACVKFHYYMSGLHVGRLNVYLKDHHGNERLLWRLFGHQNNTWSEALVPVDVLISQYQVIVEAKKGFGYLGDIAIDEITFSREKCSLYPLFASPNGSPSDGIVITSSTVRIDSVHHQYLSRMLKQAGHNSSWWRPCYHALHYGWDVSTFHQSCDNKGPTLTIVRKDNYVFGGFTEQSWRGKAPSGFDVYFWRQNLDDYVHGNLKGTLVEFTVSLWLKSKSTASNAAVFALGENGTHAVLTTKPPGNWKFCMRSEGIRGTECVLLDSPALNVVDGFWHQVTVKWRSRTNELQLFKNGIHQGTYIQSDWSNVLIPRGDLYIGRSFRKDDAQPFIGRITSFNVWDDFLSDSVIALFPLNCRKEQGNLFKWSELKDNVKGLLKLVEPSSCSSENYQADGKAFIFSLNYTSQSYLFKKEIGEASSSSAIYSSLSTGPTFGEAPFDFQIGINGNMREGSSQHVISYRGGNDVTDSNLGTVLAGASNFTVSDVEVLYKEQGASLCDHQCPYNYFCDEINGGCRCKHERDFPRLCELYKHYNDCTHFWPLESVGNIEDVITHTWGVVKGGVHTAGGLLTDGVSGEVQLLDSEGNSCATKHITNMNCIDHGFTVALRLKYFNRADGQKQVLFKSFGKFVIYQESNDFLIFRIEVNNRFCVKEEVAVAEKIWSHIVFTFSSVHPKTLTVYRNGEKLNEFLRSEPCSSPGQRQYLSPSVSLGAGLGVFANVFANFDDVAIWDHVLTDERIAELSKANTDFFPFKVGVVVRITNQSWHEDLYLPGTARYNAITSNIINNVTMFYSNYSEVRVSVVMNEYRPGSVKANFTIEYNVNNFSLIEELNKTIFYSGRLYDLPVELIEMTTYFVPSQAPPNFRASQVSDTSIDLAWQHPELSSTMWEIFQGYKIFVRPAGSSGVHSITINAQKTVARLQGLKSLVTYDISIAAYTFAGVGKESEIICITTTLDAPPANVTVVNVTTSCVRIKWDQVPPEQIGGMFQGYKVMMIMVGQQSSSSDEFVTNNATNEADICNLLSLTTFEFYVTRFFLNKTGNRSDVQNFTTLEQAPLYPPKNVKCHNRSSTALVVQWQQPPINGMERSFIRGYKVLYHTRNIIPRLWGTQIVCNCTFNTTVVKLEKYSEYNILVAAFNRAGLGNFSDVVRCFTDEDIPLSGPANITALNSSSTSVELHWSPVPKPLRLGLITHYTFNVTEVSTGRLRVVIFDSATLSGMVRNLSKYTEYSIVGAAANSKGQSNFTVAVTCRTNEDAPDLSPLNVTAFNTSSTSIMVEFQAPSPEKLNGIIRKFRFTFFKAGERNATVRRVTADRQHSRRRRESLALTDNTFKSELRNLEEYTMFSIQVAFITVKEGPYSKIFNASTDEGVPRTPPLQVAAFNSSSTSIMIVWQNLTSTSVPGILLGYKLRYIKADDNNATEVIDLTHGLKTYKNITNLEVFTLYNISVAGYTRMGVGNASVTQSWTDEGVPAGPPNKITVDSVTSTTIALSWLPVAKGLQNGIIRGYQLYLYRASEYATYTTLLVPSRSAVFGGLTILSNYSIQIRAFTRKGYGVWSGLVNTSTGAGAPDQIPMNSTAQAAGPMTIHVTWSPVVLAGARVLRGYRIKYFAVDKPHLTMDITVGSNGIYANLTGLRPFTVYNVQVAAFSSEEGNFTSPLLVKTWEGVPSAPPSRFCISVLDSQTFLVRWVQVPLKHQNGIIRGYRLTYWNAVNGTSSAITMKDYQRSYVLRPLRKATKYVVQLWAFTNAGDGTVGTYTALTDEDVPSKPPSKLAAQNYIGLTKIPISWEPVPQEFVHGYLAGYRVTYQAVYIGDLPADSEPVISEDIGPVNTSLTLQSLESLTVYRITVAARTNKGPGPEAVTFGKTCRCRPRLTTNWRNYPPYVNLTSRNDTGIIIPHLLVQVVDWCCGWCREHNRSKLDLNQDGNNQRAQRITLLDLQQNIDNKTDFSFPVIGHKLQDSYKGGLGYAPFVESAGVAFVVYTDTSSIKQAMFAALLACWPVIVIPAIMGYIAGVLVWILDTHSNEQHFPRSFISGTWEGVWWAFVSMTTVGYGDRCPSSYFGRIFAVCWVLTGLVIISITTGALTTALTTIAKDSDPSIYGSKVGAIYGSPEYNLGVRKNAIMSRDKLYHSLEELSDALINREVDGILIDTYAGGNRKELFTKPFIRVARIIDYQTAYGVVIGGDSMRLRHCFHGYMRAHQAEIFSFVEELVKPITGSGVSNEEVVQDISTGLFDSGTNYFRNTLLLSSTFSITAVVIGLCYEVVRRIRGRRTVEQDKSLSVHKDKMIEEMSLTVADFVQHSTNTLSKMKAKYKKEILKRAKHSTRGLKRLKSPITSSLESNLTKEDDISVISLEDDDGNSKC